VVRVGPSAQRYDNLNSMVLNLNLTLELKFTFKKHGRKGKKKKSIYIAPFILCIVSKRSDMDDTVLPTNYTMPAFPS